MKPDIIEIIQFNLNSEGYQIFTANDGLEAIKSLKNICLI